MIEIRPVIDADLPAAAELRWRWVVEVRGGAVGDKGEYVHQFAQWASQHAESHRCVVAVDAGEVIGMAWLAIVHRVPTPHALSRASGDVQCVYVSPEYRDSGVGGQMIDALLELARSIKLERVTVHSSSRAVPVYERHGFQSTRMLLQTDTR